MIYLFLKLFFDSMKLLSLDFPLSLSGPLSMCSLFIYCLLRFCLLASLPPAPYYSFTDTLGFVGGSVVKNPPVDAGRSLGWEDTLRKEMAAHCSVLA